MSCHRASCLLLVALGLAGCRTDADTEDPACRADGVCNGECPRGEDADCVPAGCAADGLCNPLCGAWDPDCVAEDCSADLTCNPRCAVDPDCAGDPCVADGECFDECGEADPDCAAECEADFWCNGECPSDPDCTDGCGDEREPCCAGGFCAEDLLCRGFFGDTACFRPCDATNCGAAGSEGDGSCIRLEGFDTGVCIDLNWDPPPCTVGDVCALDAEGGEGVCVPLSAGGERGGCFETCPVPSSECDPGTSCVDLRVIGGEDSLCLPDLLLGEVF